MPVWVSRTALHAMHSKPLRLIVPTPSLPANHRVCRRSGRNYRQLAIDASGPPMQACWSPWYPWRHTKVTPGARFRQMLIFLWFTACPPGEAPKLQWTDVDMTQAVIVLREYKARRTQKTPRPRVIRLHPVVVKLLAWLRQRNQGIMSF
jgi:hypothetical protein